MEQYIPKSALVAEIGDLVNIYKKCPTRNSYEDGLKEGRLIGYKDALHKIDTLEVKEVDLDKELESWRHNHFHGRRDKEASGEYLERVSQLELAKHFFELGLQARTDKELVEKVYGWLKNYAFVDDEQKVHLPTLLHDFIKDSRTF